MNLTPEEHEKWERYYREALDRDYLREAYRQADLEDAERERKRERDL
jgi:hypothetical protein